MDGAGETAAHLTTAGQRADMEDAVDGAGETAAHLTIDVGFPSPG